MTRNSQISRPAETDPYTYTNIHTYTYTNIHTYTYTNIHTYTHTNIHTYTVQKPIERCSWKYSWVLVNDRRTSPSESPFLVFFVVFFAPLQSHSWGIQLKICPTEKSWTKGQTFFLSRFMCFIPNPRGVTKSPAGAPAHETKHFDESAWKRRQNTKSMLYDVYHWPSRDQACSRDFDSLVLTQYGA